MHLEDWPHVGAFNYRMKGFSNQTCHHYFKHYQQRLIEILAFYDMPKLFKREKLIKRKPEDLCIGGRKRHQIQMDLMLQFKREYLNLTNTIALMHYVENSHDSNDRFNWIDNDLFTFLETGYAEGLFNNTAIFLFSDHGARFSDKRENNYRYLEERLPFFAVYLPQKYREKYPEKYNGLKINAQLLTSPFDIYATVRDLANLKPTTKNALFSNRSISLLSRMPNRNCELIGISEHFCSCVQVSVVFRGTSFNPVYKF